MRFSNGDVVTLTPRVKAVCVEPEKYERGIVTDDSGIWNIYEVRMLWAFKRMEAKA